MTLVSLVHGMLMNFTLSILTAFILLYQAKATSGPIGGSAGIADSLGEDLLKQRRQQQIWPSDENNTSQFQLPAIPLSNIPSPLVTSGISFFCRKIDLTGYTVFSSDELSLLTKPYTNREISNLDLQQLRHELSRYYINRGYINSGAIIPDQNVIDGVIEIQLIEGKLDVIDIEGNASFKADFLIDRIGLDAKDPLQINRLQENLQLLLENPLIEHISADLRPGSHPGSAQLKTLVKEKTPYQFGLMFDNQLAPSIGSFQGTAYAAHRNLTGNGDIFSAQGRFAEGLTGFGLDYWLPVNRYSTALHSWYAQYESEIIEKPFNQIDVTSNSESYGITLLHPFLLKPGQNLSAAITLERRRSNTFLLGQPFSFSPGVQDGESSVTVLRLGQEWVQRDIDQIFAVRSTFNVGVDALDATINPDAPDGQFFSWLGQMQWGWRFADAQLIWRTDVQTTPDGLLPLEKFQIGGANSVRGYRENQLVRDWGFSTTLEYRYAVLNDIFGQHKFFLAAFTDVGGAWNIDELQLAEKDVLASVGLGLVWDPESRFHAHLYWGKALVDVNNPNQDPQDYGFHFKLSGQLF